MSVYNYVANSNPNNARWIIDSFGYEVVGGKDLGRSLNELVAQEGEPALKKIMESHPDKEIILELFSSKSNDNLNCNCAKCQERNHSNYLNASGAEVNSLKESNANANTTIMANQTNVILIVATLFIATALIITKKN